MSKRLVIGVSGASGIAYGIKLLTLLKPTDIETHLIVSKSAERVRQTEVDLSAKALNALADVSYSPQDIAAKVASGSFKSMGMIVAPCSMRSLAEIANGLTTSLLTRAADVVLKEQRRLVLMVRETPLHEAHLQNMLKVTQMGGVIAPPVPAFYNKPENIDDLVTHAVGRVLDLFDIDVGAVKRWE